MKCPKCGYQSFNYLADCKKCGRDLTELQGKFGFNRLGCPEGPAPKLASEPAIAGAALEEEADSQPEIAPSPQETHREKRSSEESLEVFFQSLEDSPPKNSPVNAESIPVDESYASSLVTPTDIERIDSLPDGTEASVVEGNLEDNDFNFPFEEMDADLDALQNPLQDDNEPFLFDIPFDEPDELSLEETFPQKEVLAVKPESGAPKEDTSFQAVMQRENLAEHSDGPPTGVSEEPLAKEDFFSFQDLAEDLAALAEAHDAPFDWDRPVAENFESTSDKSFDKPSSTATEHPDTEKWPFAETSSKNNNFIDLPPNLTEDSFPEDLTPKEQQRPEAATRLTETPETDPGQSSNVAGGMSLPQQDLQPKNVNSDLDFELLDADEPVVTIESNPAATSISQEIHTEPALLFAEETGSAKGQGIEGKPPRPGASLTLRSLALLADLGILSALFLLFVLAGEIVRAPEGAGWFSFTPDALLALATPYFLVLFALCFGYFTLFHYLTGQTPGKMLWGIRVEAETGDPLSLAQAFLRTVGGLAALLPVGLGFLSIPMNSCRRGWNDKLASSRVVGAGRREEKANQGLIY